MDWLNKLGSDFMHVGLLFILGITYAAYTNTSPKDIKAATPNAPIVRAK